MFDSLNRGYLPPYGNKDVYAPNFNRLAQHCVTYDNFFVGSMPCMPARRELHTGRYNFLHRSWCPCEPYDDSVPAMLKQAGVYTHIVTDHFHYWTPGGFGYVNKYNSFETFRGQSGDPWKGEVQQPIIPQMVNTDHVAQNHRQDQINRKYMQREEDFSLSKTFDAGLQFIETNVKQDNWFLQLETFAPHEPFYVHEKYREIYKHDYSGNHFDWPDYYFKTETNEECEHIKCEYKAHVSMCDAKLGQILDIMDKYEMWNDTMLIVNTDHGFLLGEHDWFGKLVQPMFSEISKIPFFMYNPLEKKAGIRSDALYQTIDIATTLFSFFDVKPTEDMLGMCIDPNSSGHEAVLFGYWGSHVYCCDGKYIYMRAPDNLYNEPSVQYGIIPAEVTGVFPIEVIKRAKNERGFSFSKGITLNAFAQKTMFSPVNFESTLYEIKGNSCKQIYDIEIEITMAETMKKLMLQNDAPTEQFVRLGLPLDRKLTRQDIVGHRELYSNNILTVNGTDLKFEKGLKQAYFAARHALEKAQRLKLDEDLYLCFKNIDDIIVLHDIMDFFKKYAPSARCDFLCRTVNMSLQERRKTTTL